MADPERFGQFGNGVYGRAFAASGRSVGFAGRRGCHGCGHLEPGPGVVKDDLADMAGILAPQDGTKTSMAGRRAQGSRWRPYPGGVPWQGRFTVGRINAIFTISREG